jgi:hypothetical protein
MNNGGEHAADNSLTGFFRVKSDGPANSTH